MKVERIIRMCENFGMQVLSGLKIRAKKNDIFFKKSAVFRHFSKSFVIFYIKVKGLITKDLTFEIVATISEFN